MTTLPLQRVRRLFEGCFQVIDEVFNRLEFVLNVAEPLVDDEPDVAGAYAELLSEKYNTQVAHGGHEALDKYGPEIDVVLLDRRMPDISGDEVLERLRDMEGDSRVAMVTAMDPGFDVIEMGFDEYVVKPVSTERLDELIQKLMKRSVYEEDLQEYFSLVTKKARLEAENRSRSSIVTRTINDYSLKFLRTNLNSRK